MYVYYHPYQAIPLSPWDHSSNYQSPHLGHKEKREKTLPDM